MSAGNDNIRREFKSGITIEELSDKYYLSVSSIKMIVYSKKQNE